MCIVNGICLANRLKLKILLLSRRSSIGTFIRSHPSSDSSMSSHSNKPKKEAPPKLDYRSMVSIDDMPALFVSFDSKSIHDQQVFLCLASLFPRPHLFRCVFLARKFFFIYLLKCSQNSFSDDIRRIFLKFFFLPLGNCFAREKRTRKDNTKRKIVVRKVLLFSFSMLEKSFR